MSKKYLAIPLALGIVFLLGAGCAKQAAVVQPSPEANTKTSNNVEAEQPVAQISDTNTPSQPSYVVPANWLTAKLNDLGVSISYPSAWGNAGVAQSLKTSAGTFKTVAFSAFSEDKLSVDLYYYSSNYKPTANTPYPPPMTPPTCNTVATTFSTFGIKDCVRLDADGKTIILFENNGNNSYTGWLYTGIASYPVLEIDGPIDTAGVDLQMFKKVLQSVR